MKKIQSTVAVLLIALFFCSTAIAQWSITGNTGTTPGTNFIGTTDAKDLVIKTVGLERWRISQTGRLLAIHPYNCLFIGNQSGNETSTGQFNVALGNLTLNSNLSGYQNTAVGDAALKMNATGQDNTALGAYTLNVANASFNTAVGSQSMFRTTSGAANVGLGIQTLVYNLTGSNNTAIGTAALFNNLSGNNTGVGYLALSVNTTGSNNTALGFGADVTLGNLTNATAIGYNAKVALSNSLVLGGTGANLVNVGIGTTSPSARLEINSTATGVSGLKFTQLTSASTPASGTGTALGVDPFGNVILVPVANANGDIVVSTTMNLVANWDLNGATLVFQGAGNLTGTATVSNGYIQANSNKNIIGANITLSNMKPYGDYFSACWFGAHPTASAAANATSLQKAINTCIANGVPLFIPPLGTYNYSTSLNIANGSGQVTFHMYGGSQFWSSSELTTLAYQGTGGTYALGIQQAKGVEVNNLKITGKYLPPTTADNSFFLTRSIDYQDTGGACNDSYSGIVIDPPGTVNGSTGVKIHDVWVSNFAIDFSISPSTSQNSDILIFEDIHVGDSKYGFQAGDAQSKGNVVRGLYSWGRMHTLISIGTGGGNEAGFWTFDGGNIAGKCIRLFNISAGNWYSTIVRSYFTEAIGSIGTILVSGNALGEPPMYLEGCNFHFNMNTPVQTLLFSQNARVKFESCTLRYYTGTYPGPTFYFKQNQAPATFSNTTLSSNIVNNNGSIFLMD